MNNANPAGLLVLDKPAGMTSRAAVDVVVRIARTKRVGHAGTLDPLATGVLVVCLGWATRLVPYVQELKKTYVAEFLLGRTSDTDDVTGAVVDVAGAARPSRSEIVEALPAFMGKILQRPPAHSAVHVAGRRAYQLAREGQAVVLEPREVVVHRCDLVEYNYPRLKLEIECGSGTYIRSIGRDLGEKLGCGAVMNQLERRAIGEFQIESAISLGALTAATWRTHLLPPLAAVRHWPRYVCSVDQLAPLQQGRRLTVVAESLETGATLADDSCVAVVNSQDDLLAIAELDSDRQFLQPRQVFIDQADHRIPDRKIR